MKINASQLSSVVRSTRVPQGYALKVASRVEPGQSLEFADGSRARVVQKSASPDGMRFVLFGALGDQTEALHRALSFRQFAALGPVSPAMRRLASFLIRIAAQDAAALDAYVKEAIRAEGLPVDEGMNWGTYLPAVYMPMLNQLTRDEDLRREAIHDTVIRELYQKKVLSPNSEYAHFDTNATWLTGTTEADRVTGYLKKIFSFSKVRMRKYVMSALGLGGDADVLKAPVNRIEDHNGDGNDGEDLLDMIADDTDAAADMEGKQEVAAFLDDFKRFVADRAHGVAVRNLQFITDCFLGGDERLDIRQKMVGNPEFQGRGGKTLDKDSYNFTQRRWSDLVQEFAQDPEGGWSGSPIATMIAATADRLSKGEPAEKKAPTRSRNMAVRSGLSGLHMAAPEMDEGQQPPAPGQPMPPTNPNLQQTTAPPAPPPAPAPPPPPNPNVQQQQTLTAPAPPSTNGLNMAQPAGAADPPTGPRKTISPEIPGVNHTARQETPMPTPTTQASTSKRSAVEDRIRQRRFARKFGTLRRIAEQEPEEVASALDELQGTFDGIADRASDLKEQLDNLEDHLDLDASELPKEASVRQKVAKRNVFARELKRIAAEDPEQIEGALNDFYSGISDLMDDLDSAVTDVETLADNLGLELTMPEPKLDAEPDADSDADEEATSETVFAEDAEGDDIEVTEDEEAADPFSV